MRNRLIKFGRRLLSDCRGATAIEYALIATLIGTGIVFLVLSIGQTLAGFFTNVSSGLNGS
jgi:pilus assembly protein Flp/PilA